MVYNFGIIDFKEVYGMKTVSPSQLRQNLAKVLDEVATTNIPVMVSGSNRAPVFLVAQDGASASQDDILFNQTRLQILGLGSQGSHLIDDAYLFAWESGLYPYYHDEDDSVIPRAHVALEKHFLLSGRVIKEVADYLDDCWMNKDKEVPTWYEMEDHYSSRSASKHTFDRSSLLKIVRYLFLLGFFDEDFWEKLLTPMQHPSEARGVRRKFDVKELGY